MALRLGEFLQRARFIAGRGWGSFEEVLASLGPRATVSHETAARLWGIELVEPGLDRVTVPRDRDGSFEPELVKKGQTRIDGIDDKIIGLYAHGLTVRDIQAHLEDLYGLKVSPDLISRVTDAVLGEVREWQSRALERMYPIVIFDALRVKIRDADSRMVKNKAVYVALGVTRDGLREVLGLWVADNEGAKFWLSVMNELRNPIVGKTISQIVF